jgi:hypothetical protein
MTDSGLPGESGAGCGPTNPTLLEQAALKGDHQMLSLGSSNATPMQQLKPSDRLSRRTTRSVKIIAAAAAVALLAARSTFTNAAENPSGLASVQHACAVVLGLDSSGPLYDACIRSLERSLSQWDYARLVPIGRDACSQEGLQPGTAAFAVCVLKAEESQ